MLTNHQNHELKEGNDPENLDGVDHRGGSSRMLAAILALITIVAIPACFVYFGEKRDDNKKQHKKLPVMVTSAFAKREDVPLTINAVGNVESMESVSVRSRVDGELTDVFFKEGDDVRKGQLLFKIDPRTSKEAVQQAAANLAQCHSDVLQQSAMINHDIAELRRLHASFESTASKERLAKRQWDRYSDLVKQGAVSLEQEDQMRTNFESMAATLKMEQAAIDNQKAVIESDKSKLLSLQSKEHSARSSLEQAKIQLSYSTITSPVDGRTGSLLVHRGNMIKANDPQALVVINRLKPIYVTFALPESDFAQVKQYEANGSLKVDVLLPTQGSGGTGFGRADTLPGSSEPSLDKSKLPSNVRKVSGRLSFVDNAVQTTTGTIKLKGTFDNEDAHLWPGQFVNVSLHLTTLKNVVVVPKEAVQVGQQGQYVFVIKPDNGVEVRPVSVNRTYEKLALITAGLLGSEQVVTDGQVQLSPTSTVTVQNGPSSLSTDTPEGNSH
ncbi:MAG: efflux RND transporter periplasmic adaptor subunit [Candidatus Obscuribacterales bacterium]|nr:efflux RND transporter periplasmic adaptor subunit [Candidatus Obscuribacterales bacterium]